MKNLYKELNAMLGGPPVIELPLTEKAKGLKAGLFIKFETGIPCTCPEEPDSHPQITDRRIKAVVADAKAFSGLEEALRLLRTHIPDLKIFAADADMSHLPEISTGFLEIDPDSALFTKSYLAEKEHLNVSRQAAGVLAAACKLAGRPEYENYNLLVFLSDKNTEE